MQSPRDLLYLTSTIAEPCETIRQKAVVIAAANEEPADMRQASVDLAVAIDHMFEIASYMLKNTPAAD